MRHIAFTDSHNDSFNPDSEKFSGTRDTVRDLRRSSDRQFLGFRSIRGGGIFWGVTYHILAIPYWILIPPTAILPILWMRRRRRNRYRSRTGRCLCCGYDLRESKEKCPECGAVIAVSARA